MILEAIKLGQQEAPIIDKATAYLNNAISIKRAIISESKEGLKGWEAVNLDSHKEELEILKYLIKRI